MSKQTALTTLDTDLSADSTPAEALFGLDELTNLASLTLADAQTPASKRVRALPDGRTLRYYTTLGIVDRPASVHKRQAMYTARHLTQLVAIKRLQAANLSLADIQTRLASMSQGELEKLAAVPPLAELAATLTPAPLPAPARDTAFWLASTEAPTAVDASLDPSSTFTVAQSIASHDAALPDSPTRMLRARGLSSSAKSISSPSPDRFSTGRGESASMGIGASASQSVASSFAGNISSSEPNAYGGTPDELIADVSPTVSHDETLTLGRIDSELTPTDPSHIPLVQLPVTSTLSITTQLTRLPTGAETAQIAAAAAPLTHVLEALGLVETSKLDARVLEES